MDFNAIVTAVSTAWAQITEVVLNLFSTFDWNAFIESISKIFEA